MNFIRGQVKDHVFKSDDGCFRFDLAEFTSQQRDKVEGKRITLGYRPENAVLQDEVDDKTGYVDIKAKVEVYEMLGDLQNVYLVCGQTKSIIKVRPEVKIEIGKDMDYLIRKSDFHFFDSDTEDAIEL